MADGAADLPPPQAGEDVEPEEDGADGAAAEPEPEPEPEEEFQIRRFSLAVLPVVTEEQRQHGLRHEDYERYRRFCTQKLRRVRRSVGFTHGKKNYNKKELSADKVTDERFLLLPLFQAERAWGFFMQLKEESKADDRKKFHALSRCRKACKYATMLKELVSAAAGEDGASLCDERTELEVAAYSSWMNATLGLEVQEWTQSVEQFSEAKLIYERLSEACLESQRALYLQRIDEIIANLRYCAFMLGGSEGEIDDLLQNRGERSAAMNQLAAKLEKAVLDQQQKSSIGEGSEVTWCGRSATIANDKLRVGLMKVARKEKELAKATEFDDAMALYDELYGDFDDAIATVSADLASSRGAQQEEDGKLIRDLEFLHAYIIFNKLERSVERTLRMVSSVLAKAAGTGVPYKPDDVARLYALALGSVEEAQELEPLQEDPSWMKYGEGREASFKGHRCFYLAEGHIEAGRLAEGQALLGRATEHARAAQTELAESSLPVAKASMKELTALLERIRARKCVMRAASFSQSRASAGAADADAPLVGAKSLAENIGVFGAGHGRDPAAPNALVPFPPPFEPTGCKPLYFDLAGNHLDFPPLADRVKAAEAAEAAAAGGISSMLGGAVSGIGKSLGGWFS